MPINVVSTIKGLCKGCFSCIRHCPAKAIKVEDGQAMVVWEYCIGCGHCVQVCSQNAKIILSGVEKTEQALKTEKPIACLAPSFVAQYSQYHPGQVISAVKKLGFTEVWEVAFGAYLVTQAYQKHVLSDQEKPYYISTSCPAIINLVEKHYPEFIPYLVPIVSPMIALGRYLKKTFGDRCRVVFIGPCVAKKDEAEDAMVMGAIDAVLTYQELDQLFQKAKIDVEMLPPSEWDSPPAGFGRLYPVSGGLLRSASMNLDPLNYEIIKLEGQENCMHFIKSISNSKNTIKFADMLFCDGCISGPMLKSDLNKLERQKLVVEYTKENAGEPGPIPLPEDLKLTREFRNRSRKRIQPTDYQIRAVLTELGKFSPEDELNCGACGYNSCREKAVAVFQGLAESKMCLPFLIANLESHNVHLRKQLTTSEGIENMIGNSVTMQKIYDIIKKVAPTDSTVLIRGKSGTGKELVANALYQKGLRSKNNYVSINCAALPENLLESELFGHTKGAFTGAVNEKKGLFDEANGGTLFLDEIGDLSPHLQVKLLRVLQEGEYLRIGETTPRKCDVRIIAATNQNLEELIAQKKFREDLYYRLNVVTICLPELRERKEDIPILIKHFLDKFNKKHNKNVFTVSKEAMTSLVDAPWPGNVRELENAIERAVILCEGTELTLDDLPPSIVSESRKDFLIPGEDQVNFHQSVDNYKRMLIIKALEHANGIQAQAARQLGIGRSTLNEIIKKLNISTSQLQER
jgi:DNA-binding NtrC family response regulator/iron only hydrogenase large subunit-like protein